LWRGREAFQLLPETDFKNIFSISENRPTVDERMDLETMLWKQLKRLTAAQARKIGEVSVEKMK
jgi:hypothetical protein